MITTKTILLNGRIESYKKVTQTLKPSPTNLSRWSGATACSTLH